ncbi:MAG: universal stress protein [Gammaproteobacteria bacterium]|nr:universal stress protein [Gammaproteobacteria bacterium]
MSSYSKILVAVDLSEESGQVVARASNMADEKTEVSIIHVVKPIEHVYGGFGAVGLAGDFSAQMATLEQQAVEHAEKRVAELAADLGGVPAERQHVCVGNASSEIHRIAKEAGAELVVIGSHGRHGLGLLLGSTANAVLHGTSCDVLAVRVRVEED